MGSGAMGGERTRTRTLRVPRISLRKKSSRTEMDMRETM